MLTHPHEKDFHFYFKDEDKHYKVPTKTNHNLYSVLLELELANSIIDILDLSQNQPEKRLIAAFRYAKQLLDDTKGLCNSDNQKLQEVQRLIDICDNPDILKDLSEYDYPSCLVAAANYSAYRTGRLPLSL